VKGPWTWGLEGHIVKIKLCNGQAERAASLKTGAYYKINNLRLKNSMVERQFLGFLGGPDVAIQILDPDNQDDHDLNDLIRWVSSNDQSIRGAR
jgi:hypothetical protein